MAFTTDAPPLMSGPLALIFGVAQLWLAAELWVRPTGKFARRVMTSRLLGSPTGKLYFYRLLAPVLGVASTIAGVWMIGANIDNGADWSRLFGPLEWHAMTLNMLAIYGGVVVGIIDIWKRQMPFRWPLTLAGLASGTATGQFIAFRFGVQRDRWAVLMLLSVAALIWLSTQAARNSRATSSTVGLK